MLPRVVVIAVMVCLFAAAGSAQTAVPSSDAVRKAIRASVTPARPGAAKPSFAASPAGAQQAKKNIWKTPWPYVIVLGAAAGVYFIAKSAGGGSGY
jgi:hypothetical protein